MVVGSELLWVLRHQTHTVPVLSHIEVVHANTLFKFVSLAQSPVEVAMPKRFQVRGPHSGARARHGIDLDAARLQIERPPMRQRQCNPWE